MRNIGIGLWLGGLMLAIFAIFIYDPSIGVMGHRVVNLDLQQRQMMMLVGGAAAFITGCILHGITIHFDANKSASEQLTNNALKAQKKDATDEQIETARRFRIEETEIGYRYRTRNYSDIGNAIRDAERDAREASSHRMIYK